MVIRRARRAFTLLEICATLAVVSVVMLIGAAVVQNQGRDVSGVDADVAASRVLLVQQSHAASRGTYAASVDDLAGLGRDITVQLDTATEIGQVSMAVGADGRLGIAAYGRDDGCHALVADSLLAGGAVQVVTVSSCSGTEALIAP